MQTYVKYKETDLGYTKKNEVLKKRRLLHRTCILCCFYVIPQQEYNRRRGHSSWRYGHVDDSTRH